MKFEASLRHNQVCLGILFYILRIVGHVLCAFSKQREENVYTDQRSLFIYIETISHKEVEKKPQKQYTKENVFIVPFTAYRDISGSNSFSQL
jgi:hypothetical protein